MKFFIRFFLVVAVLLGIFFGYFFLKTEGKDVSRKLEKGMSATFVDKNAPASSSTTTTQQQVDFRQVAQQAATMAGVTLLSFENYGNAQDVLLEWRGSNNQRGADFVDNILKVGHLRDFEESAPPKMTKNSRGETVYLASFRLYMK